MDLVAEPATTAGLYEHEDPKQEKENNMPDTITLKELRAEWPDLVEQIAKEARSDLEAKLKEVAAERDVLQAEKKQAVKLAETRKALKAAGWSDDAITEQRLATAAKLDQDELKEFIAGVPVQKPKSKERHESLDWLANTKSFAESVIVQ